jgi:hypothetical protein
VRNREAGSSALGAGGALGARVTLGLSRSRDATSACRADLLEQTGAAGSSWRGSSRLGGGLALEVASTGDSLGVGIDGEGELLLAAAHAIGAVSRLGAVPVDTSAVLATLQAANETEHVAKVLLINLVGNNAVQGVHHAAAKLGVGGGREGVRLGLPFASSDARARSSGGVGRSVLVHLDAAGSGLGNLLGQVVEVLVGCDLAVLDRGETWSVLAIVCGLDGKHNLPNLFASSWNM